MSSFFLWFCKFFICSNSLGMVKEYSYYISTIVSGRLINLRALFLSVLCKGLKLWIDQLQTRENKPIRGLMWFLFLCFNEYFLEFYRKCSVAAEQVRDPPTYALKFRNPLISTSSIACMAPPSFSKTCCQQRWQWGFIGGDIYGDIRIQTWGFFPVEIGMGIMFFVLQG